MEVTVKKKKANWSSTVSRIICIMMDFYVLNFDLGWGIIILI